MINTDMTVYRKSYNTTTKLNEWTKEYYDEVVWTGGKGASLDKGILEANDITVRVPVDKNDFTVGDVIIRGSGDDINVLTDLTDYYTVNSVIDNSFYSSNPHIHLGAK